MSATTLAMIEFVLLFGGVIGFGLWQIRSVRRLREEDARKRAAGDPPAPAPAGKRSAEDIFWDTVTRPGKPD